MNHDTLSNDCWCGPRFYLPCDECDVPVGSPDDAGVQIFERGPGCWKCRNGLIELTREEADADDRALVIVHNMSASVRENAVDRGSP